MSKEVSGVGKKIHNPPKLRDIIRKDRPNSTIATEEQQAQTVEKVRGILSTAKITVNDIYAPPHGLREIYVGLARGESKKISQIVNLLIANGAQKTDDRKRVILDNVTVNVDLVKLYYPAKK